MKHIVCFSGGHQSAVAAIETVRKYGRESVVLLNHDISSSVEHKDIKRFKQEVAEYIGLPITYANADNFENMTPLKCMVKGGGNTVGLVHCTKMLKTEPFMKYLKTLKGEHDVIYGFDMSEPERITRKSQMMGVIGYKTDFPLIWDERTIENTEDVGIKRPATYKIFKHANCFGCLKAGLAHWYVVYCLRPDIFQEAITAEREIAYSIQKEAYMKDLIARFEETKSKGICPNDKENGAAFWANVDSVLPGQVSMLPCDCAI